MIGTVECGEHGERQATFVCEHIQAAGKTGDSPGFNYVAGEHSAFPDAWCDACDARLIAGGGEWNDETEPKITLLCSKCYSEYRSNAARHGKERAH